MILIISGKTRIYVSGLLTTILDINRKKKILYISTFGDTLVLLQRNIEGGNEYEENSYRDSHFNSEL